MVTHSTKPLVAVLFLTILSSYSMRGVLGAIEIAYDDGSPETTSSLDVGMHLAVKFSLPSGMLRAKLVTARIYKAGRSGIEMRVHILGGNGMTELTRPFDFSLAVESTWNDANVGERDILVSDIFYITVEYLTYYDPLIGRDTTDPKGRSYHGHPGSWNLISNGENVMIRAVVEPSVTIPSTVSGTPVVENFLIALAPYFFLLGVATLIFTASMARKRRGIQGCRGAVSRRSWFEQVCNLCRCIRGHTLMSSNEQGSNYYDCNPCQSQNNRAY